MIKPLSQCVDASELLGSLREMSADPQYASDRSFVDYWILNGQDIEQISHFGRKKQFIANLQKYVSSNLLGSTVPDRDIPAYDWILKQLEG